MLLEKLVEFSKGYNGVYNDLAGLAHYAYPDKRREFSVDLVAIYVLTRISDFYTLDESLSPHILDEMIAGSCTFCNRNVSCSVIEGVCKNILDNFKKKLSMLAENQKTGDMYSDWENAIKQAGQYIGQNRDFIIQ